MKRRTLDLLFSVGAGVLAVLLVVMGFVMANRANFAKDYVGRELKAQDVQFTPADKMDAREKAFTQAHTGCALTWAGQTVTTGKQAECYANEVLGAHLTFLATRLGMTQIADLDGKSYRQLGVEQSTIKTNIASAQKAGDAAKVTALQSRLTDVGTLRDKVFQGTMLRNALLTSYGFSELGRTASQVETVAWWVAAVLFLLALGGFAHALMSPAAKTAVARTERPKKVSKELASV